MWYLKETYKEVGKTIRHNPEDEGYTIDKILETTHSYNLLSEVMEDMNWYMGRQNEKGQYSYTIWEVK